MNILAKRNFLKRIEFSFKKCINCSQSNFKFSEKYRKREESANLLLKNKYSILYSISSIGFLTIGYPQFSLIAGAVAVYYYLKKNEKFRVLYHNTLDENFIKTSNNKVLVCLE